MRNLFPSRIHFLIHGVESAKEGIAEASLFIAQMNTYFVRNSKYQAPIVRSFMGEFEVRGFRKIYP